MWIFKSFKQDFLRIYLSAILAFLFLKYAQTKGDDALPMMLLSILVFNFSDVGHVYTTIIKTWMDPGERKYSKQYWLTPLTILIIIVGWRYIFNFNYFWACVVYFDLWHNLKQGYGVMKWYESLNQQYYKLSKLFYYGLTLIPFAIFNVRVTNFSFFNYYTSEQRPFELINEHYDFLFLNHNFTFDNKYHFFAVAFYILFLNIWLVWELNNYLTNNKLEKIRLLAMVYYGSIYGYCFIFSQHFMEVLILLISSHGVPYLCMLYKRMDALQTVKKHYGKIIFGLLIFGGSMDYFYNTILNENERVLKNPNPIELILIILYLLPVLTHFVWDGYLWKKDHPDSIKVYKK